MVVCRFCKDSCTKKKKKFEMEPSHQPPLKKLQTQMDLKAICKELSSSVKERREGLDKNGSSPTRLLFQRLMELNRLAAAETRNTKKSLAESKGALDASALTLQNLQYERLHLEREITATETFATIYQDIPLLPVKEFEARAPEDLKLLNPASDPHQMMLNQLTFELQERKRLAERVKGLKEKKAAMEKGNKALVLDVSKLDTEIEALLTSTIPLQSSLGLRITKRKREDATADLLPDPLQKLYQSIQSYNDSSDSPLNWDVIGDRDAAKTWREALLSNSQTHKERSVEPESFIPKEAADDDEERLTSKRRFSKSSTKNYYSKHPLEFLIRLPQKSSVSLKLTFSYFDQLKVIGVVLGGEKNASLVDLTPSFVLSHLVFDDDDGTLCPDNVDISNEDFTFESKAMGNSRPYKWAQYLCSLHPSRSESLSDLVSAMSDRWRNMKGLESALELLKLTKLHTNYKLPTSIGRIKTFRMSTEPSKSVGLRTYYLTLEIKSVTYDFTVDVSAAYPKKVPVLTFITDKPSISPDGEENVASASLSLFMNGLLSECHNPDSLPDPSHLLFWQVSHLMKKIYERKEDIAATGLTVENSSVLINGEKKESVDEEMLDSLPN